MSCLGEPSDRSTSRNCGRLEGQIFGTSSGCRVPRRPVGRHEKACERREWKSSSIEISDIRFQFRVRLLIVHVHCNLSPTTYQQLDLSIIKARSRDAEGFGLSISACSDIYDILQGKKARFTAVDTRFKTRRRWTVQTEFFGDHIHMRHRF